jgi:hypothetical protein
MVFVASLNLLLMSGSSPPEWLDPEFLYRINYGPATAKDVQESFALLGSTDTCRESITLLDRRIADSLHKALFGLSSKPLFKVDTNSSDVQFQGNQTPYDYPQWNDEAFPLMWCEEFTVQCIWALAYSSEVLGKSARPSMVAVALDMIDMVTYLNGLETPRRRTDCLQSFFTSHQWRSIPEETRGNIDTNWASEGYLHDLFRIVIAWRYSQDGWDALREPPVNELSFTPRRLLLEFTSFPGSGSLNLGKSPMERSAMEQLYGSLEDMKASFISSGPYKLAITANPANHLTLNNRREIRLFCETIDERGGVPGRSFRRYKTHTLGELLSLPTQG